MTLKLAKHDKNAKQKTIKLEDIAKEIEKSGQKIFYFDQNNAHKDLVALVDFFEEKGYSVYLREVKFGLDENDYLYEVHIL